MNMEMQPGLWHPGRTQPELIEYDRHHQTQDGYYVRKLTWRCGEDTWCEYIDDLEDEVRREGAPWRWR